MKTFIILSTLGITVMEENINRFGQNFLVEREREINFWNNFENIENEDLELSEEIETIYISN